MKFPSAFCYSTVKKSWISSRDGGTDESRRPWRALQGRSTTGATTQLPLSSALPPQAVARAQVTAEAASPAAAAEPRAELPRTAAPRAGTGASAADTQGWAAERPAAGWLRGLGERDSDTGLSARGAGPGPARPGPHPGSPRLQPAQTGPTTLPGFCEAPGRPCPPPAHPPCLRPPGSPRRCPPDTTRPRRTGARGRCDTSSAPGARGPAPPPLIGRDHAGLPPARQSALRARSAPPTFGAHPLRKDPDDSRLLLFLPPALALVIG